MNAVQPSSPITIEGLTCSNEPTVCRAAVLDSQHLEIELEGTQRMIREVAQHMLGGAIKVRYRGATLVLTHFTVFNQGERKRLLFQATHRSDPQQYDG
ncbi:MAG TPA: hypothetical protein VMS38_19020 [Pseudorhodoferax sp.]|nr:hypothetical protein [Pseudorhodoferax sp.]